MEGVSPGEALVGTAPEEVSGSAPSFDCGSERSGAGSRKSGLRASASEASPREAQGCEVQGHRGIERPSAAYLSRRGQTAAAESFAGFPTGRLGGRAGPARGGSCHGWRHTPLRQVRRLRSRHRESDRSLQIPPPSLRCRVCGYPRPPASQAAGGEGSDQEPQWLRRPEPEAPGGGRAGRWLVQRLVQVSQADNSWTHNSLSCCGILFN